MLPPWDRAVGARRAPHPRLACGAGLAVLATRASNKPPQLCEASLVCSRADASRPRVHHRHVWPPVPSNPPGFT
eukprot:scaffold20710_cov22-Phaeocystis_antarctica.AAC.2